MGQSLLQNGLFQRGKVKPQRAVNEHAEALDELPTRSLADRTR